MYFLFIKKVKVYFGVLVLCYNDSIKITYNGFVYDTLRVLARKLENKNRIENPRGFP